MVVIVPQGRPRPIDCNQTESHPLFDLRLLGVLVQVDNFIRVTLACAFIGGGPTTSTQLAEANHNFELVLTCAFNLDII